MQVSSTELHSKLLEIMLQFHNFCIENSIKYYLLGGSALGAKRHKGFIPWDDDMDIGIPREDYNRLVKMDPIKLPENLELRFYQNTEKSPFHFIKLIEKNTTLIERQYTDYVEGLYIDIFPLDGAASERKREVCRRNRIWNTHMLLILHYLSDAKSNPVKRIVQLIARCIPPKLLHDSLERQMTKYSFNESNVVANYLGSWKEKEIMPKSVFGEPTLYKFENVQLFGPEDLDSYLKYLYGGGQNFQNHYLFLI